MRIFLKLFFKGQNKIIKAILFKLFCRLPCRASYWVAFPFHHFPKEEKIIGNETEKWAPKKNHKQIYFENNGIKNKKFAYNILRFHQSFAFCSRGILQETFPSFYFYVCFMRSNKIGNKTAQKKKFFFFWILF